LMTLKKYWSIVYDMIYGKHTNDFGWDATRKVVTTKQEAAQIAADIIEDLEGDENDNGGTENIKDSIGVEKITLMELKMLACQWILRIIVIQGSYLLVEPRLEGLMELERLRQ
ncbi:hypothetical protein J1N35_008705, partial [Gossypium stocksii]